MSDYELETRTRIIDSVIKKRNTSGEGPTEEYVAHLKIWETENGQDKMRYVILAGVSYMSSQSPSFSDLRTQLSAEAIPSFTKLALTQMGRSLLERHGN